MSDLSVTALYTSAAWAWGRVPGADLLVSDDARRVFGATNAVLGAVRLFRRGLPSLRHSLLQRHTAIDRLLAGSGARHVLELAAGLSPRGAAVSADPRVQYTEVDRAPVIARKRALLQRTAAGRDVLARPNLRLVERDLAAGALADLVTAPAGEPLFVIAEGLLMYLDAAAQRDLWARVRALFAGRSGRFVFDLVPTREQPRPGVLGRALDLAMRRFTGGATFTRDDRGREDLARELGDAGFTVEILEPREPRFDVPTQQLLFVCQP